MAQDRGETTKKNVGMYLGWGERHQIPILLHRTLGLSKATIVPGRKSPHFAAKRTGKQQRLSNPEPEKYGKTGPRSTAQFKHPPVARNSMKFREWHHSHRLHMERCRITSTALKELHGFIELLLRNRRNASNDCPRFTWRNESWWILTSFHFSVGLFIPLQSLLRIAWHESS